jgi:2-phospho-L-lactate guanylyltransferase
VSTRSGASASRCVVLVPVKAFAQAKGRLASVLSPSERYILAKRLAERVIEAASPFPVAVVCDDSEVAAWATAMGARVISEPGCGLNGAVDAAYTQLSADGYERVIVAHSDLPLASTFLWLASLPGIVLVPDRHLDGTNVISLPTGQRFRFSYGPGSFARHQREAGLSGLDWRVVYDQALSWDVDVPSDMSISDMAFTAR